MRFQKKIDYVIVTSATLELSSLLMPSSSSHLVVVRDDVGGLKKKTLRTQLKMDNQVILDLTRSQSLYGTKYVGKQLGTSCT